MWQRWEDLTCKKTGHLSDVCWVAHQHLKRPKKVQGVDEEKGERDCSFIDLGVIEVRPTDNAATTTGVSSQPLGDATTTRVSFKPM